MITDNATIFSYPYSNRKPSLSSNNTPEFSSILTDCITQFKRLYTSEEDCISLVHKLRWPAGFQCPHCEQTAAYIISTRRLPLYECRGCGHQTSLTSGTVMHKSRTPLHKWLLAMYIIATCEDSINAVQLSTLLSVTYKTAWAILSKIRQVISETDRKILLSGAIEAKLQIYMERFLPVDDNPKQEKPTIISRTFPSDQPSYYKIKQIKRSCPARENLTQQEFHHFASEHASAELRYAEVNRRYTTPYKSQAILSRVAAQAFRWMNKTFHSLGRHSFQTYLDEFCFRINNPVGGKHCPFEYVVQLGLNAIRLDAPALHYKLKTPCRITAA